MKAVDPPVDSELRRVATTAATGYFGAVPRPEPGDAAALEYVRSHPNDEFLRRQYLRPLNACRALISALTETPYPFPGGPFSRPAREDMMRAPVEAQPVT